MKNRYVRTVDTVEREREREREREIYTLEKVRKNNGITLVALVITIIILLILEGVAIGTLGGENGLLAKVNQSKKAHIKAEMKENLTLAITELQTEKLGKATLDDITQEWANEALKDYETKISTDPTIDGKKIQMTKSDITGKFLINEKLEITDITKNDSGIEFTYEATGRIENKVKVLIHIQDKENGLSKIELSNGESIDCFGKKEYAIDNFEAEMGKEYKVKITSSNGETKEETILITDYWYTVTKKLGENAQIDNTATKAAYNKPYEAKITTTGSYAITGLTVKMGGQEVTTSGNNIVDIPTGRIYIEKVTENIEITVTTKEIKITYTTIAVSTSSSASNTSSSKANSQPKGIPLYINIIANIEGTPCIITLKGSSEKVPYQVTANGKYVFNVSGTYNGKEIIEEKEVTVNQYQAALNLVQYDAGEWTAEEIQSLKTAGLYNLNVSKTASNTKGLDFTFGGFTYKGDTTNEKYINNGTVITSRNKSVAPQSGFGTPKYDGWQILSSYEENGKTYVTKLVHAGCPENFVYYYTTAYDNRRVEYILSSGLRQTGYSTYSARSWQMYVDKNQKNLIADTKDKDNNDIKDIHAMTYEEALAITGSINTTTGIRNTGSYYWLGSAYTSKYGDVCSVGYKGDFIFNLGTNCWGCRPVVSLKSGVYIKSGDGVEGSPYILGIE